VPDSCWSLTVDVPADELVRLPRRKGGGFTQRPLGIPALHNLRGPWTQHHVVKAHKALLDAGHLRHMSGHRAAAMCGARLRLGCRFDVLIIRRAPRPLDAAIQEGEWKRGGRQLYGDNASSADKAARDWTAKHVFGLEGDSSPLIRWHTGQERSARPKLYQLEIRIYLSPEDPFEVPRRWLKGGGL